TPVYFSTLEGSGMEKANLTACPANTVNAAVAGKAVCSSITVDGEPCSTRAERKDRFNNGGGRTACGGSRQWNYLQAAAPGDYLQVDKEFLRLLVKTDEKHWIVERGVNRSEAESHAAGAQVRAICSAGTAQRERGRALR